MKQEELLKLAEDFSKKVNLGEATTADHGIFKNASSQ